MPAFIPGDKQKHIIVGALISIAVFGFGNMIWPGNTWLLVALAIGITALVGFGFELFSYITGKGHAETMDAFATVAGGIVGCVLYWLGWMIF